MSNENTDLKTIIEVIGSWDKDYQKYWYTIWINAVEIKNSGTFDKNEAETKAKLYLVEGWHKDKPDMVIPISNL